MNIDEAVKRLQSRLNEAARKSRVHFTQKDQAAASMALIQLTAQAAEIERLTAALKQVQHSMAQVAIPGNDARREFELIRNTVNDALLRPQPQPAQAEPKTPTLSRYAADIAALAAGEITEEQFCARQGRKPV